MCNIFFGPKQGAGGQDILCPIPEPMPSANKLIQQSGSMGNMPLMPIHDVILWFHA